MSTRGLQDIYELLTKPENRTDKRKEEGEKKTIAIEHQDKSTKNNNGMKPDLGWYNGIKHSGTYNRRAMGAVWMDGERGR